MKIPNLILTQLYEYGSLENFDSGVRFTIQNRLSDFTILSITRIAIDNVDVPLQEVEFEWDSSGGARRASGGFFTRLFGGGGGGGSIRFSEPVRAMATDISPQKSLHIPLRRRLRIESPIASLQLGKHKISLSMLTEPFGEIEFTAKDSVKKRKAT